LEFSLRFREWKHPGSLVHLFSIVDDQRHKWPIVSHCFLFTMALKGMEPAPNPQ